jgi:hypothetical protein
MVTLAQQVQNLAVPCQLGHMVSLGGKSSGAMSPRENPSVVKGECPVCG